MGDSSSFLKSTFEFVVAGLLSMAAVVLFLWTAFPHDLDRWYTAHIQGFDPGGLQSTVIFTLLTAMSYALGITVEYVARSVFEWRLDKIKARRIKPFLVEWEGLRSELNGRLPEAVASEIVRSHGLMRFAVIEVSEPLAVEVEDQIKRLRLIRVLCLVEALTGLSAVVWTVRTLRGPMLILDLTLVAIFIFSLKAVENRFDRYCRAIERSFLLVMLSRPAGQ